MQISSIVDIVGGELLNSPSISFITQIHTLPSKINDGDLFISNNKENIKQAINQGAFAIISSIDIEILDEEIAWIKVDEIKLSLVKILRFLLAKENIKSYFCDKVSFNLLKVFSIKEYRCVFLSGNIINDFELVKKDLNINYILSDNKTYLESIQPLCNHFNVDKYTINNLTKHSLFMTTFSYKSQLFYKLRLPSLFINQFISVYEFYNEIDTTKLKNMECFIPVFINKNSEIVDFGKSNKFIIASKSNTDEEIKFLKEEYGYAKIAIIDNYIDDIDLYKQIKSLEFNALYIIGKSNEEIKMLLNEFITDSLSLSF